VEPLLQPYSPDGPTALPDHPGYWCNPLDDDYAEQLIERTLDRHDEQLRIMTRDHLRFSTHDQLEHWLRGDHSALCLQDVSGTLFGILWIGPKLMPVRDDYLDPRFSRGEGPDVTLAIRLYGAARGRHMSLAFAEHAIERLVACGSASNGLWFETRVENRATRALAAHYGFKEVSGESGGRVVGVCMDTSARERATSRLSFAPPPPSAN
jgi:hypothetical protein